MVYLSWPELFLFRLVDQGHIRLTKPEICRCKKGLIDDKPEFSQTELHADCGWRLQ
jgi:hypothetical protein